MNNPGFKFSSRLAEFVIFEWKNLFLYGVPGILRHGFRLPCKSRHLTSSANNPIQIS